MPKYMVRVPIGSKNTLFTMNPPAPMVEQTNSSPDLLTKIIEGLLAVIAGLMLVLAKLRAMLRIKPSTEHYTQAMRKLIREEAPGIVGPLIREAVADAFRDHLLVELRDEVSRMQRER